MMKKTLLLLLATIVLTGTTDAKIRMGLKGGLNFASFSTKSLNFDNRTGWHAGLMMNIGLPLGLSLQPELLYSAKGVNNAAIAMNPDSPMDMTMGYIEIPVELQWGIKLPLIRPYISLAPYLSYAVNDNISVMTLKKWDKGIGIGAGVDIWKLQVSVKYVWGFGELNSQRNSGDPSAKNRNVMLSVGLFL